MTEEDIAEIITDVLYQFPVSRISLKLPGFIDGLDISHNIKQKLITGVREWSESIESLRDVIQSCEKLTDGEVISDASILSTDPGTGSITVELSCVSGLFYKVIGEIMECDVRNDRHFFELIRDFSHAKKAYEKLQSALEDVEKTGYGIVRPQLSEMQLKNPDMFRQGNRYGVKIKATAPSLHMIRTDITTEVSPIVGSERPEPGSHQLPQRTIPGRSPQYLGDEYLRQDTVRNGQRSDRQQTQQCSGGTSAENPALPAENQRRRKRILYLYYHLIRFCRFRQIGPVFPLSDASVLSIQIF